MMKKILAAVILVSMFAVSSVQAQSCPSSPAIQGGSSLMNFCDANYPSRSHCGTGVPWQNTWDYCMSTYGSCMFSGTVTLGTPASSCGSSSSGSGSSQHPHYQNHSQCLAYAQNYCSIVPNNSACTTPVYNACM